MKTKLREWSGPILLLVLAVGAWGAIIWVALQVSAVVLNTLDMIVKLAGMTP